MTTLRTSTKVTATLPALALGLGAILVLMLFVAIIGLRHMEAQQTRLSEVVNIHMRQARLAAQMRHIARERTLILYRLMLIGDPFARDAEILRFGELAGRFGSTRRQLLDMDLSREEQALIREQGLKTAVAVPIQDRIIELLHNEQRALAIEKLSKHAVIAQNAVLEILDRFAQLQQTSADEALTDASQAQQQARQQILVVSVLAFALGLALSIAVLLSVRRSQTHQAHLATHDNLTQLPNRTLLADRLKQEIRRSRRQHSLLGLLFIDLDRFKEINDAHGHAVGDQVLIEIASRLKHRLRASDTLARLGGDEFVLLLSDAADIEALQQTAEKIIQQVCRPIEIGEQSFQIGASIGIAAYPRHADSAERLLHNADLAMYAAKKAGRNRWHVYGRRAGDTRARIPSHGPSEANPDIRRIY